VAPHIERLKFRLGMGGQIAENLGEWDFALNKVLHKALDLYLARR
jgi:lipid II:glycine glycyltransferase (peptidoglycan interpeptide bridge formation enzyme)